MDCSVQCPHCGRLYPIHQQMFGNVVACPACGQAFQVPAAATAPSHPQSTAPGGIPASGPAPFGAGSPYGAPVAPGGFQPGAFAAGDPFAGAAFGAGGPLSGGPPTYRRRRMSAGDTRCLFAGIVSATAGLGCLLVLFPLAEIAGLGWTVTGVVLAIAGAGLLGVAQRRNLVVALPAAAAIVGLVVIGVVIRPLPKTQEQLAEEYMAQTRELVAAMDSIHDEETLRLARPKVRAALTKMFQIAERAARLAAEGQQLDPEVDRRLTAAAQQMTSQSNFRRRELLQIPGGEEFTQEMARIVADGEQRLAAIAKSAQARQAQSRQGVASPQRLQELKDFGIAYHSFFDNHPGQAPTGWSEFERSLSANARALAALRALRADGWVVHWGVGFRQCTVGTSNFVLAHAKDSPENGGTILTLDGAAGWRSAEEIRQMLTNQSPLEPAGQGLSFAPATPPIAATKPPAATPFLPQGVDLPTTPPATTTAADDWPPDEPGDVPRRDDFLPRPPSSARDLMPGKSFGGPPPGPFTAPSQVGQRGRKSELVGGNQPGAAFQSPLMDGPVTGVAYRTGQWAGEPGFADVQPLREATPPQGMQAVVAKSGYAVGGITADTGKFFHAMQIVFMRIRPDGRLDPDDAYTSQWIGTPVGQQTKTVSGKGAKVVGLHGQRIALVHSIGLILE